MYPWYILGRSWHNLQLDGCFDPIQSVQHMLLNLDSMETQDYKLHIYYYFRTVFSIRLNTDSLLRLEDKSPDPHQLHRCHPYIGCWCMRLVLAADTAVDTPFKFTVVNATSERSSLPNPPSDHQVAVWGRVTYIALSM